MRILSERSCFYKKNTPLFQSRVSARTQAQSCNPLLVIPTSSLPVGQRQVNWYFSNWIDFGLRPTSGIRNIRLQTVSLPKKTTYRDPVRAPNDSLFNTPPNHYFPIIVVHEMGGWVNNGNSFDVSPRTDHREDVMSSLGHGGICAHREQANRQKPTTR